MHKAIIAVGLVLAVAACSDGEPVRSVEWFKAHAEERAVTLTACRNNPGEKGVSPNCSNAQAAENALANARRGYSPLPSPISTED